MEAGGPEAAATATAATAGTAAPALLWPLAPTGAEQAQAASAAQEMQWEQFLADCGLGAGSKLRRANFVNMRHQGLDLDKLTVEYHALVAALAKGASESRVYLTVGRLLTLLRLLPTPTDVMQLQARVHVGRQNQRMNRVEESSKLEKAAQLQAGAQKAAAIALQMNMLKWQRKTRQNLSKNRHQKDALDLSDVPRSAWEREKRAQSLRHKLCPHVDIVTALFSRLLDAQSEFHRVLQALEAEQVNDVANRLGWLHIFDPLHPDMQHRYRLDLSQWDHRVLVRMLLELALAEGEPSRRADNWSDCYLNANPLLLPVGWLTSMPWAGQLEFCYTTKLPNVPARMKVRGRAKMSLDDHVV